MPSVLQDWVGTLPLRAQGTLLTAVRCCDEAPKNPPVYAGDGAPIWYMSAERHLHAFFRFLVLNPADPREVDHPGAWFQSAPPLNWKPSMFGHYPLHWYTHLTHSFEVAGYLHPNLALRRKANEIYNKLVRNLHLKPETEQEMLDRLQADRIVTGEVVS